MGDEEILNARSMSLQTRRLQRKLKMKDDKTTKTTSSDDIIPKCRQFFEEVQRQSEILQSTINNIVNITDNCIKLFIEKHSDIITAEHQQKHVDYIIRKKFEQSLSLRGDTGNLLILDKKCGASIEALVKDSMIFNFQLVLVNEEEAGGIAYELSGDLMRMLLEALVEIESVKKAFHSGRG